MCGKRPGSAWLIKAFANYTFRFRDALGPPNAQGTYTGTGLQYATLDGRLREIQETLQRQRKKTEVEMLELKKESQRAQVRLTSRVSKLERRQR